MDIIDYADLHRVDVPTAAVLNAEAALLAFKAHRELQADIDAATIAIFGNLDAF